MNEMVQNEPKGFLNAIDRDGDPYKYLERLGDRRLVVHTFGNPRHTPFFLLHGGPGWGGNLAPRRFNLENHNAFVIAPTRPGYYESDPQPGRTYDDTADDVAAIAKALNIEQYYVIGRSMGGLHAIATLGKNGKAVLGAAALGSMAPPDLMDSSWTKEMIEANAKLLTMTDQKVTDHYREKHRLAAFENDNFVHVPEEFSDDDLLDLRRLGITEALQTAYRKSYQERGLESGLGWPHDILALRRGFGDTLSEVDGRNVLLFYNEKDRFTPLEHGIALKKKLPNSQLIINYQTYPSSPNSLIFPHYDSLTHFGGFSNLLPAMAMLTTLNR